MSFSINKTLELLKGFASDFAVGCCEIAISKSSSIKMQEKTSQRNIYDFTIDEIQHVNNLLHKDFPENIREIIHILYMQLIDSEKTRKSERMAELAQVAVAQMERLSRLLGGTTFYFPKGIKVINLNRDKQIVEEFKGFNTRDLALKYGLSEERIRQIIKSEDKKRRKLLSK